MGTNNQFKSKKEIAVSFLELVVSGHIRNAYENHVASDFRHHNPYFPGDKDSLMQAMEKDEENNPGKIFKIQQVIHEGDTVAVHSHLRLNPDGLGMAVVHIFRFQNEKIVEMWDIGQQIPEDTPNENVRIQHN